MGVVDAAGTSNERSTVENVVSIGVGRYTSTGILVGGWVPSMRACSISSVARFSTVPFTTETSFVEDSGAQSIEFKLSLSQHCSLAI